MYVLFHNLYDYLFIVRQALANRFIPFVDLAKLMVLVHNGKIVYLENNDLLDYTLAKSQKDTLRVMKVGDINKLWFTDLLVEKKI